MLDYAALGIVSAVVREGSFEGAAQALGITSSAISQRVKGYEEKLGALLIIRGQPCQPTTLGKALCAHIDKVRLLEAEIPQLSGDAALSVSRSPTLKIAVNADSLATWFPSALSGFVKESGVFLDLLIEDEAHTADRLRSGDVMAAVTADSSPVPGCRTLHLGALRYAACASPDFVQRYFSHGWTQDAFSNAPCMCFEKRDRLQTRWLQEVHQLPLPQQVHYIPTPQGFLDFALAGMGWGLQPLALAKAHLESGRLVELAPKHRVNVNLNWVTPRLKSELLDKLTRNLKVQCLQSQYLDRE